MGLIVLAGNVAFSLASLVVGIRLLRLARRTGQLPERLIGISFLIAGAFGHTLGWVAGVIGIPNAGSVPEIIVTVRATVAVGATLIMTVAWRVFRPTERWARVLFVALLLLLVPYVTRHLILGYPTLEELARNPLFWSNHLGMSGPYAWIAIESLAHQRRIRRQFRIGLPADLLLAGRLRLWGIGLGAVALLYLTIGLIPVVWVATGVWISQPLAIAVLGMTCAGCLWAAFFPPRFYVRRLQALAAADTA